MSVHPGTEANAGSVMVSPMRGVRKLLRTPPSVSNLLLALLDAAPHSLSKDECLDVLSGADSETSSMVVKVQVCNLRSALRYNRLPVPETTCEGYHFEMADADKVTAAINAARVA